MNATCEMPLDMKRGQRKPEFGAPQEESEKPKRTVLSVNIPPDIDEVLKTAEAAGVSKTDITLRLVTSDAVIDALRAILRERSERVRQLSKLRQDKPKQ